MKLAYPVATPEVRGAILGAMGAPEEIVPALRDSGYEGVEPFVGDPGAFDAKAWIAAVRRGGLTFAAIGTGPVVFDHKLAFTHPDSAVRRAAIERAKAIVRFAAECGTQVNIGKLRGDLVSGHEAQSRDWMRAAFTEVCAAAAELSVVVTLEPQNRSIINNLNTTAESLAWLRAMALPNLRLMLDVFHMACEGENIPAGLASARDVLRHVHYADTGRRSPGEGHLDFSALTTHLRALGYDRFITLEIKQGPDCLETARRAAEFLQPRLRVS